jgi:peptide/nickel transport system permease protein
LSAAVVVEIVFNLPGVGSALIVDGVLVRDYPVVQGIVLVFGLLVVVVSGLADILNGWIDPRTRLT